MMTIRKKLFQGGMLQPGLASAAQGHHDGIQQANFLDADAFAFIGVNKFPDHARADKGNGHRHEDNGFIDRLKAAAVSQHGDQQSQADTDKGCQRSSTAGCCGRLPA